MRTIAFLLFSLIAAFFALIGMTMPLMIPAQAAQDRMYYRQFTTAAAYIKRHGKLPAEDALQRMEYTETGPSIWTSIDIDTPLDCDPSFEKAPGDRLVLSFWRGEWSECYAYPSGRTTLPMSVHAYFVKGLGVELAIFWLVAATAAWGAIRVRPRVRASVPIVPIG